MENQDQRWKRMLSKLSQKQCEHLRDVNVFSLLAFQNTVNHQDRMRAHQVREHGSVQVEPCWECRAIARKLGVCPLQDSHIKAFFAAERKGMSVDQWLGELDYLNIRLRNAREDDEIRELEDAIKELQGRVDFEFAF